jgi:effector-binding domain-containing protein
MQGQIVLVDTRPRSLAAVRVTTILSKWPSQFMNELNKVYKAVHAGKVRQTGQNVMVYHPRNDGRVDIECGVEIDAKFETTGEVAYCETPAGPALTTAHIGPYDKLGLSHCAIVDWSRKNGRRVSGICWEIYGDWDADPTKLRTDIFHLLAH